MLKQEHSDGGADLSALQGPACYPRETYAVNLRESLIRHLTEHIQNLHGVDLGSAVMKMAGYTESARIFTEAQEEALKVSGDVANKDFFDVGENFGLYHKMSMIRRPPPES